MSFGVIIDCPQSSAARRQDLKEGEWEALGSLERVRNARGDGGSRALEALPVELRMSKLDAVFAGASAVVVRRRVVRSARMRSARNRCGDTMDQLGPNNIR